MLFKIVMMEGYAAEAESDAELVLRAHSAHEGDLRAFEQLVEHYRHSIVADCRYMTMDESVAEDLAQEVFVKAYFGLRSFEGRSSFRHWLQRIKVNHCLNHVKKHKGRTAVPIETVSDESPDLHVAPTAHRRLESTDTREQITRILESMPETLRLALVMRDMDELSYEDIASELGIGLSAVKMRIKRAREYFRARYQDVSDVPGTGSYREQSLQHGA